MVINLRDQSTMEPKFTDSLRYESFQYGSGDIAVTSERDVLHLYEVVDSVPCSENLVRENFSFQKENNFSNIHGKQI